MELSKKAQRIEPSVTLEITAKAKEMKENGVDVISFGAGEPDFNTPKNIIDAAIKAMNDGNTKYTSVNGILPLREAICKKFKEDNGLFYKPSQIVVSTGAKQSLANTFLAILNPGDEVIVPTPYWVSYPELIKLADGKPVFVKSDEKSDYKFTKENLENVVSDKTKAIVLNTPNNPTGTIYSADELKVIANFAKEHDLIIVSDEMYEKLIYDGEKHISIASISQDAYERTIVINGLSKSYAMTGWRMGYITASKENIGYMNKVYSHSITSVNQFIQYGGVVALNSYDDIERMRQAYQRRRDFFISGLNAIDGVEASNPDGAFYAWVKFDGFKDSDAIADFLLEKAHVASVSGKSFSPSDTNHVRFSFAASDEELEKAVSRIKQAMQNR